MSADAKVWKDRDWWRSSHDGPCACPEVHSGGDYHLSAVIHEVEACMGEKLRWDTRQYQDDTVGLVGYAV